MFSTFPYYAFNMSAYLEPPGGSRSADMLLDARIGGGPPPILASSPMKAMSLGMKLTVSRRIGTNANHLLRRVSNS